MQPSAQHRIVCLGEILIDRVIDAAGNSQDLPGGAPANVAAALARLGVPVAFVGGIGQDAWGEQLVSQLQQLGVETQGVQRLPYPTRVVEVVTDAAGDRTFGGFLGGGCPRICRCSSDGNGIVRVMAVTSPGAGHRHAGPSL